MTLAPGTRLSGYQILELVGSGGMGEVYRARDDRLGRDVAVKVLPEELRQDRERLERFEREARVLASLNHPGIATLYGLESSDGITFLAMELVPGETLQERLSRGPLSLEEARDLFLQIAEALEAAHASGVVHRDLKPANIKITPQGKVKILDFGLAKAFAAEEPVTDLSHSPTVTRAVDGTREGVILGTASYMSPEQARARTVDKRADIWAFGCVLFEALTGRKAFDGESVTDILANVIHKEAPWDALPSDTPWRVRDVLRRCLAKDAGKRFHDIADVGLELGEESPAPVATAPSPRVGLRSRRGLAVVLGAIAGATVTALVLRPRVEPATPRRVERYTITPPRSEPPVEIESPAISPDGSRIVFVGLGENDRRLYLRDIESFDTRVLEGTDEATWPFFSPDGLWVGFFGGNKLKKISVLGGAPIDITDAFGLGPGATWAPDGNIWFSGSWISGLYKVSSDGGDSVPATVLDSERGDVGHWWPDFLPGGETALITIFTNQGTRSIAALDLESGGWHVLFPGMRARYARSGHVVYYHAGVYQAVAFDPVALEVRGPSVPVLSGTRGLDPTGSPNAFFDVSNHGTAVTVPGGALGLRTALTWLYPNGETEPLPFESAAFRNVSLDPRGERLAVSRNDGGTLNIWSYDLSTGAEERLTRESNNMDGHWTPDGSHILFTSARRGAYDILTKAADPLAPEEPVVARGVDESIEAISPDGRFIAIVEYNIETGDDLSLFSLDERGAPRPLASTPSEDNSPSFSRDSAWVAFRSLASGRSEVYVQPVFDGSSRPVRVSPSGGRQPLFSRAKDTLYYLAGDRVMAVRYRVSNDAFHAEAPLPVVDLPPGRVVDAVFDVAPDDSRFLVLVDSGEDPPPTELRVITNWFEELNGDVPPAR